MDILAVAIGSFVGGLIGGAIVALIAVRRSNLKRVRG
jgi:ABC-type enterobactin transport system permease subunit